jgi:hypothetical protein
MNPGNSNSKRCELGTRNDLNQWTSELSDFEFGLANMI